MLILNSHRSIVFLCTVNFLLVIHQKAAEMVQGANPYPDSFQPGLLTSWLGCFTGKPGRLSAFYGFIISIAALSAVAVLTQTIYGIRSNPAGRDTFKNERIVMRIVTHRMTMTTSPMRGDRRAKKTPDHKMLRINWVLNTISALLGCGLPSPFRHIRKTAMPIRTNNVSHTGANTQFGGVKNGFFRLTYHVVMEGAVKREPRAPAI